MSAQNTATAPVTERDLFIAGQWVPAGGGRTIEVTNPATEQLLGHAGSATEQDVDAAVTAARTAFDTGPWPRMSMAERAEVLVRLAGELAADTAVVTELLIAETGLTRAASAGGAMTLPGVIGYNASLAASLQSVEIRKGVAGPTASIERVPVGVVVTIIPWNSPLGLAAFKLPQALLAGCTVVMKPSEVTPLSAGYIADASVRAGMPPGVLNVITALPQATSYLVAHPGVDKVSFTGSTAVGRAIAAGAAPTLKQLTLELGGKSAALVLDDASTERVVHTMVPAVVNNNGEVCTMPSRLVVPRARQEEIVTALAAAFAEVVVGDPSDPATDIGPMVNARHHQRVMGYLDSAIEEGGTFAVGGKRPQGLDVGYYVEPTIITGVSPQSRVAQEEIFGPVLTVLPYDDEEEAFAIINGTEYGLAGAVYSADADRALAAARRFVSGNVFINNGITLDISVPFGGVKQSGYGRELGPEGVEAYRVSRTIFLDGDPLTTLD